MKPALKRDKSHRVLIQLALILVGLLCVSSAVVAQTSPNPAAPTAQQPKDELWQTENLPADAVFRYGSTERHPRAIGIYVLRFSADGKLIAFRDRRQSIRVLDLEKRRLLATLPTQITADFLVSPDNKQLIVGNSKSVQVWNIADAKLEREFTAGGYRLAMSPEPHELVTVGKGVVNRYRWPLPSKPIVKRSKMANARAAAISEDGKLAVFQDGRACEVLNTVDGSPISPAPRTVPKRALISPNSNLLANINYSNSSLRIFDLRNAMKHQFVLKDKRPFVTATFSNDSRFLYSSHYDNAIVIWDMVTMKSVARIRGHGSRVYALEADPNRLLCLASGAASPADRTLIYWNFRDRLFPSIEDEEDFTLDLVWDELGSDDAKISLAATNRLYRAMQNDPTTVKALTDRMGIDRVEDDSMALQLVDDLDNPKYDVREKATVTLKSMVDTIRPMLERRLGTSSQEAKWRINRILRTDRLRPEILTVSGRRGHRIILALELCGTAAAADALELVSKHSSNQNLVNMAKDAIRRSKDDPGE